MKNKKLVQEKVEGYGLTVVEKNVPRDLKSIKSWVAWKAMQEDGKKSKVPIDPRTGKKASVINPNNWGSFREALKRCRIDNLDGVGIVLTLDKKIVGIDLDGCREPED